MHINGMEVRLLRCPGGSSEPLNPLSLSPWREHGEVCAVVPHEDRRQPAHGALAQRLKQPRAVKSFPYTPFTPTPAPVCFAGEGLHAMRYRGTHGMASAPMAGLEAALRLRFDAQIDVDARELRPAHRAPHFSVRWLTQNNEGRAKYRGEKFSGADRDDQPEQSLAPCSSDRPCLRSSPQRVDEEVLRRPGGLHAVDDAMRAALSARWPCSDLHGESLCMTVEKRAE